MRRALYVSLSAALAAVPRPAIASSDPWEPASPSVTAGGTPSPAQESGAGSPSKPSSAKPQPWSFIEAVKKGDFAEVRRALMEDPSLVNAKDERFGATPLHWAALRGHQPIAALLIADGADSSANNNDGESPLQVAERAKRKEVIALLRSIAWTNFSTSGGLRAASRWTPGSPNSKEFLADGYRALMIVTRSLAVFVFIESNADPLRIRMHFLNQSDRPIDVIPESFSLEVVKPLEKAKALHYVSPRQIAKKIENEAAWAMIAEALSGAARSMAGTTTTTSGTVTTRAWGRATSYGTYNGISRTYDEAANQRQTQANLAAITSAAEARKVRETTGALLPNTVFPEQSYGGIVHFQREKRAELMILRVPFGGTIYEFPLELPIN